MPADLTESEYREARHRYNADETPLIIPLSSGRTALFTRRMEFIGVEEMDYWPTQHVLTRKPRAKAAAEARPSLEDLGL